MSSSLFFVSRKYGCKDVREHDLRRAIPPRGYVFGHEAGLRAGCGFRGGDAASEPKVADLQVAVGVEQEVRRLEVAVDDVDRVQRFQSAKCPGR